MLGKIFDNLYVYRVKKEILAQSADNAFVEYIFNIQGMKERLIELYRGAYYSFKKESTFLSAIYVLEEAAGNESVPMEIREECITLLAQRLIKAQSNRAFWRSHIMILGHAEETVHEWMMSKKENDSDE